MKLSDVIDNVTLKVELCDRSCHSTSDHVTLKLCDMIDHVTLKLCDMINHIAISNDFMQTFVGLIGKKIMIWLKGVA